MVLNRFVDNPVMAGMLATVFFTLPMVVPLLLPLQVIVPLPLLLLSLRQGPRSGWMAAALPVLGAYFIGGGVQLPLMAFGLFILFPLLAGWMLRSGWGISHCAAAAFLLGTAALAGGLLLAALAGLDLEMAVAEVLGTFKTAFLDSVRAAQSVDPVDLLAIQGSLDRFISLLAMVFPSVLMSGWFFIQVANLFLARAVLVRWAPDGFPREDLAALRLPHHLVWGVIAMVALALATSGAVRLFGLNVGLFLLVPYLFQGLAIVQWLFVRYRVGGFARGSFYFALLFWNELTLLVTVLGLFDTWADVRHRLLSVKGGDDPSGR